MGADANSKLPYIGVRSSDENTSTNTNNFSRYSSGWEW